MSLTIITFASVSLFVDVILPLSISGTYTYVVPKELENQVEKGVRVVVQFGIKKYYSAIVFKTHHTPPKEYEPKPIEYILDERPVVYEYQLLFWEWLAFYYFSKIGDVMNAALPAGLKISSVSTIQLNTDMAIDESVFKSMSDNEQVLLNILIDKRKIHIDDIQKFIPKSHVHKVIKQLINHHIVFLQEEVEEKFKPKLVDYIELNAEYRNQQAIQQLVQSLEKRAFKQLEVLLCFLDLSKNNFDKKIKKQDLLKRVSVSAIQALLDKNIFIQHQIVESRIYQTSGQKINIKLTDTQQKTFNEIQTAFEVKNTILLHGETGSGKTEIYIKQIEDAIKQNKQVLYLVPEIALTIQLIQRLKNVFGNNVYVYHSKFSENERTEIWNKMLEYAYSADDEGSPKIILGPRSALFLPFYDLGLIIVDEEHDASFKQKQKHPYYQARDAAIYLANQLKAKVILGSATPSIESLYNSETGKYIKVELKEKFSASILEKKVVDLKRYHLETNSKAMISPPLYEAINTALEKKEQILLFYNRRGYVPYTQCNMCGWIAKCPNCDVSLVYHKQHSSLLCHYCGFATSNYQTCPACKSTHIHAKGWGTEKFEEELKRIFPNAAVARLDQDSTRSKFAYKNILEDFEAEKIDILVGTQMLTKGLDFKNVTVVGVLNADALMHFPDFRAFEKAYQTLYQVCGRTARAQKHGVAYIQTYEPEHLVIKLFLENNYDTFYKYTLQQRKEFNYPPFFRLLELTVKSKDTELVDKIAIALAKILNKEFSPNVLGPTRPFVSKINNYYLQNILIKIPKTEPVPTIRTKINNIINSLNSSKVIIDCSVEG